MTESELMELGSKMCQEMHDLLISNTEKFFPEEGADFASFIAKTAAAFHLGMFMFVLKDDLSISEFEKLVEKELTTMRQTFMLSKLIMTVKTDEPTH